MQADLIRLQHMRDAATDAINFVQGRERKEMWTDRQLAYAVVKAIEIVGEAANKVSQETQARFPRIPWSSIISMRNRTIHGYQDVDYDVVWMTVTDRLPTLVDDLEKSIDELRRESS